MDYLEEFEARYKIPLSELAFNERLFTDFNEFYQFSSNEILSIVEQECRTFEKIIDQIKPNFVIMNRPYYHHEMIFYKLCRSKGIKVLDFSPTNYSTQVVLSFEVSASHTLQLSTDAPWPFSQSHPKLGNQQEPSLIMASES